MRSSKRCGRGSQSGYIMGAMMAAVVAIGLATGTMMMATTNSAKVQNAVTARAITNTNFTNLSNSIARTSSLSNGGILIPPYPVTDNDNPLPQGGGGYVPPELGSTLDGRGNKIIYCAFYNGTNPPTEPQDNQVAPILANTKSVRAEIPRAPAYAFISPAGATPNLRCDQLTTPEAGPYGTYNRIKTDEELRAIAGNDKFVVADISKGLNDNGQVAANLLGGPNICDYRTQKLIFSNTGIGGTTEFRCVPEQDPAVNGVNLGTGTGQIFSGKDQVNDETNVDGVVSNLKFRSLQGIDGITVTTNGDVVTIGGGATALSAPGNGISLVNSQGRIVRLAAGGNIAITPSADGNSVTLSATLPTNNGTINNAVNLGTGSGQVFSGVQGSSLVFRSLRSFDDTLQITTNGNEIVFRNLGAVSALGAVNVGGVAPSGTSTADTNSIRSLFLGKLSDNSLMIRRIEAGVGITLSDGLPDPANPNGPKTLRIASDVVAGGGLVGFQNVGSGAGQLFRSSIGGIGTLRSISAGTGITVSTVGDNVVISATNNNPNSPGVVVGDASSNPNGVRLIGEAASNNATPSLTFKRLLAGSGISLVDANGTISIALSLNNATNGSCAANQALTVVNNQVRCFDLPPNSGAPTCTANQVLSTDSNGQFICVTSNASANGTGWTNVPLSGNTSFDQSCEYRLRLTGGSVDPINGWLYPTGVDPDKLVYVSHSSVTSSISKNNKSVWLVNGAVFSSITVTQIQNRCGAIAQTTLPSCTAGQVLTTQNGVLTCVANAGGGGGNGSINAQVVNGLRANGTVTVNFPFTPVFVLVSGRGINGERTSGTVSFRQTTANPPVLEDHIIGGQDNNWAQISGYLSGSTLVLDSWSMDTVSVVAFQSAGGAQLPNTVTLPNCAANQVLTSQSGALTCVASASGGGVGGSALFYNCSPNFAAAPATENTPGNPCFEARKGLSNANNRYVALACNNNTDNRVGGGAMIWAAPGLGYGNPALPNNSAGFWVADNAGTTNASQCLNNVIVADSRATGNTTLGSATIPTCSATQVLTAQNGQLTCVTPAGGLNNNPLVENVDYFEWNAIGSAQQIMDSSTMTKTGLAPGLWSVSANGTTFEFDRSAAYSVAYQFNTDVVTTPKLRGLYIFNHPDGSAPLHFDTLIRVGNGGTMTITALSTGNFQGIPIARSNLQFVTAQRIGN